MRWIWLVVLCACGDNVVPRLAARTYDIAGVTYTLRGQFHDMLRDEDCAPERWADGATYCTPAHRDAVYTDDTCSDAIAPAGGRDAAARYVATYFVIAGQAPLRRLHTTTPSTRTVGEYWTLTANGCSGPHPAPPDATWEGIADELDETAFVRLLRSAPEGGGRLQTIAWHTADGLYQPMGFHDRELGADCTVIHEFGRDRDHVLCEPPAQPLYYYADSACTQPVVVAAADEASPIIALGCEMFARAGSERTGAVYAGFAGSCQPATLPDGQVQYEVGAPVDVPVLSRVREGAGRIQAIELVSGNVRVSDRYVHDTMLDADCEPAPGVDIPRCVPTYQNIETYYRDAQCTQTVAIASENIGTCDAPVKYARDADGFHEVGAVVTAPLYVPSTGDTCMEQPPDGEPHEVGPALPVDAFVPAL